MRIGFIGLGTMGGRMASRLIEAGHTLVVHDIEPSAAAELRERGAGWAESPAEVARASDIVLTSLPGPAEVEQVAAGDRGLAEGLRRGRSTWTCPPAPPPSSARWRSASRRPERT